MQIGRAINILEEAVCKTAVFAAILDLPIGLPVSGSLSKIPAYISALLINQLLAKPPAAQATVLVIVFSIISLAPVAAADLFKLSCRIVKAVASEEPTAANAPLVMSSVVYGDDAFAFP